MIYIISGYGKSESADKITTTMNSITTECGFSLLMEVPFINSNEHFTKHRPTGEVIYIWRLD
jgi:hypothetical protein